MSRDNATYVVGGWNKAPNWSQESREWCRCPEEHHHKGCIAPYYLSFFETHHDKDTARRSYTIATRSCQSVRIISVKDDRTHNPGDHKIELPPEDISYGIIPFRRNSTGDTPEFLSVWQSSRRLQRKGGHWSFPKGHMEPGENMIMTSLRELREETDLKALRILNPTRPLLTTYEDTRGKYIALRRIIYFVGEVSTESKVVIDGEEITDYSWSPYWKTREMIMPERKAALESALQIITKVYPVLG